MAFKTFEGVSDILLQILRICEAYLNVCSRVIKSNKNAVINDCESIYDKQ